MGIEFELKYQATDESLQRMRRDLPGQEQLYQMQTTYYDTPSGAFSARHWTLRRRMENDESVCTLKTPAQGAGRREWEVRCNSIQPALLELCKLGAPAEILSLAEEGLLPICGAQFQRVAKTLSFGGSVLEVALDQGILTGGNRSTPLAEMEVELKSGEESACIGFAHQLANLYSLQPQPHSKFRRALALYKGE